MDHHHQTALHCLGLNVADEPVVVELASMSVLLLGCFYAFFYQSYWGDDITVAMDCLLCSTNIAFIF